MSLWAHRISLCKQDVLETTGTPESPFAVAVAVDKFRKELRKQRLICSTLSSNSFTHEESENRFRIYLSVKDMPHLNGVYFVRIVFDKSLKGKKGIPRVFLWWDKDQGNLRPYRKEAIEYTRNKHASRIP